MLQSSRERYRNSNREELDALDDRSEADDVKLWREFREWIEVHADSYLVWSLTENLNNHRGLLQFAVSRNHRASGLWEMLAFLAHGSDGTYGIVYVHDDEDAKGYERYQRGLADYSNEYRVWRILKGELSELDDPFLSPIVPRILPDFAS